MLGNSTVSTHVKKARRALAGVPQLDECHHMHQKAISSVWSGCMPGLAANPSRGCVGGR